MGNVGRPARIAGSPIGGAQARIEVRLVGIEFVGRDGERIQGDGDPPAAGGIAGRQILALLDQGARQRIGEDPRRQAEGDGLALADLAGGVARFQMRVHHQPGIGMGSQVIVIGLGHVFGRRQRQIHHQRRTGAVMRGHHQPRARYAIIVGGVERNLHRLAFGGAGRSGEGDHWHAVGNGMEAPIADHMAAGAHPHPRIMGNTRGVGIFAIVADEARRIGDAQLQSRRVVGAMGAQIQARSHRHRDDFGFPGRQIDRWQAGIGRRVHPGIQGDRKPGAAVEGAHQAGAPIAARHHQRARQQQQHAITQIVRIAAGKIGRGQTYPQFFKGQGARLVQPPQRQRERILADRPVAALGDRPVGKAAILFQPPRAVAPAGPGEIFKSRSQRKPDSGDGRGKHQRLHTPGNKAVKPQQPQAGIKSGKTQGGPQGGKKAFGGQARPRQPNGAIQPRGRISRGARPG